MSTWPAGLSDEPMEVDAPAYRFDPAEVDPSVQWFGHHVAADTGSLGQTLMFKKVIFFLGVSELFSIYK